MSWQYLSIAILVVINVGSFLLVGYDKRKSMRSHNGRRAPEGVLFCWAVLFGSLGVYAGMQLFRHKTKKWYFQLGIPLLIMQNLATLYLASELLNLR